MTCNREFLTYAFVFNADNSLTFYQNACFYQQALAYYKIPLFFIIEGSVRACLLEMFWAFQALPGGHLNHI